jgi:protein TonB
MFEFSFVPSGKTRRPLAVGVAFLAEATLIGVVVLVPLLFVESLPRRALFGALMLAPVPTAPLAPPPPVLVPKRSVAPVHRKFNQDVLVTPVVVPAVVEILNEPPLLEMSAATAGVPGGIPGVGAAGAGTGYFSNALSVAPPPPPPPPPPLKTAPPPPAVLRQITVGGDVQAALILQQIAPVYPSLARTGHIRGSVKLRAVVGTDGKIKNLTALSGHPLLVEAALNAVRLWIYRPTVLNGVPVEVNTEIEVRFGLTS